MTGSFVVEVQDLAHLKKVMKSIRRVKGVLGVVRKEHFAELDGKTDHFTVRSLRVSDG